MYSRGFSARKYSSGVRNRIPTFSLKPLRVSKHEYCTLSAFFKKKGGGDLPVRTRKVFIDPGHGDAARGVAYEEGFLYIDGFGVKVIVF